MDKILANQIAKLWNKNFAGATPACMTKAVVEKSSTTGYAVEVHPCGEQNNGSAFHSHEDITDIERAFRVSAYITLDEEHKLYARIF